MIVSLDRAGKGTTPTSLVSKVVKGDCNDPVF